MSADVERNKRNVVAFFTRGINEREPEAAAAEFVGPVYTQHNPLAPDGVEGFVGYLKGALEEFPAMSIDIKRVLGDGDLVALHSHFTFAPGERGLAVADLFRLDGDGKIVEHWDVVQPVPETFANDNGMF